MAFTVGFGQAHQASRASLASAPFLGLACGLANSLFSPSTLQEERDKEAIVTLFDENEPDMALQGQRGPRGCGRGWPHLGAAPGKPWRR